MNELSAEDLDTLPDGLEFIVTPPSNGYLALRSAPSRHILNFTQSHIQTGQLLFVHSGEKGFSPLLPGKNDRVTNKPLCFIIFSLLFLQGHCRAAFTSR